MKCKNCNDEGSLHIPLAFREMDAPNRGNCPVCCRRFRLHRQPVSSSPDGVWQVCYWLGIYQNRACEFGEHMEVISTEIHDPLVDQMKKVKAAVAGLHYGDLRRIFEIP